MRINELAERSGVSAATIKYYVREGLVPGGDRTGYNQVTYDESHLHRIRLIRALLDLGRLPIATAKQVIEAVEEPGRAPHSILGVAQRAVSASTVDDVLSIATDLGHADLADMLDEYRTVAAQLAGREVAWLTRSGEEQDRDTLAERAIVGTILGDALLAAVRREAQKRASATHFAPDRGSPSSSRG